VALTKFLLLVASVCLLSSTPNCYGDCGDDFVRDNKIIYELTTEEYIEIVKPFLPENPIILEAGAHGGQDTLIMGKAWPKGFIYAFEPVPKFVGFIKEELEKHKVDNATVIPLGLFSTSGEKTFYYSNQIGAASSFLESNGLCEYQDTEMKLHCINLDEWAEKNGVNRIDFMWLDMEGAEYYVLNAAPKILSGVTAILAEVNFREFRKGMTQFSDLHRLLIENGFTTYKIWGSPIHQGNALFIRSERLR
jgi:FkbM family methyltransferase